MKKSEKKELLKSPYPYFGGKSLIAEKVWRRFGSVGNYVEPFFGSGAVLLARPEPRGTETINDMDGFIINFWRAIKHDPEQVIFWADYPESEADLRARHGWLANRKDRLLWSLEDPDSYDPKIAGWWVWGINQWFGCGFCSGKGPYISNGVHIMKKTKDNMGDGFRFPLIRARGGGIHRKGLRNRLSEYVFALSERLRHVRICCGDWTRVLKPGITTKLGLTAVFLDPPYDPRIGRCANIYNYETDVSTLVRNWAIENGENPQFRIALCGYEGEHKMPDTWKCFAWKAMGGFANMRKNGKNENRFRERIWFSPYCL
jgi:DNA adenine methylase